VVVDEMGASRPAKRGLHADNMAATAAAHPCMAGMVVLIARMIGRGKHEQRG